MHRRTVARAVPRPTCTRFAARSRQVIATHGPVQGVIAHSFGAFATASWLAEDQPAAIRAAVLIGMMHDLGYITDSFSQVVALNPKVQAGFRERMKERFGAYPEEVTTGALVRRIDRPVLLVHGGSDDVVPDRACRTGIQALARRRVADCPGVWGMARRFVIRPRSKRSWIS